MSLSVSSITVPAFTKSDKINVAFATVLSVCLVIIGTLALLASEGVPLGCMADIGLRRGLVCFFTGYGLAIGTAIFVCTRREKHYDFSDLPEEPIQPTTAEFCCATRFTHGEQDHRNPLLDTWENITLMDEGGFRKYPPLPEQWDEIWGPSPITPMNDTVRLRWMGHASWLIETRVNGKTVNILTDPNWSDTIPFMGPIPLYYRSVPPGLTFEQMAEFKIDDILLTHTHRDHFDPPTLQKFEERDHPKIFCPLNASTLLPGFTNVQECSWWDKFTLENGIEVTYLPSDHASQTTALDCNEYLWGGYMISIPVEEGRRFTIYLPGDTACNINPGIVGFQPSQCKFDRQVFRDIAQKFPNPNVVLMPIDPIIGQEDKHSNVYQSIDLLRRKIRPKELLILHHTETWPFNTFERDLLGPRREFVKVLKEEDPDLYAKYCELKVGQSITLVAAR